MARLWLRRLFRLAAWGLLVLFGLAAFYVLVLRPWHLHWGATEEEVSRSMPGDDLIASASLNTTRAITIQARPEEIWPWLVQMGWGRAQRCRKGAVHPNSTRLSLSCPNSRAQDTKRSIE